MSQRTGASIVTQNNSSGTAQRYDSFAAALGNSFAWVTTEENGAEVHGKYSFPGSDEALQGQDFPFPTVLVQDNVFGRAVYTTAGGVIWPLLDKGLLTLDMITDYDAAGGESAVTLDLRFEGTDPGTDLPTLSYTKDGIVTAELQPDGTGHYKVRIVGQAIGSTEIIATLGGLHRPSGSGRHRQALHLRGSTLRRAVCRREHYPHPHRTGRHRPSAHRRQMGRGQRL